MIVHGWRQGATVAFDAQMEEYERLTLRHARELDGAGDGALQAFADFRRRFATDCDSLLMTDADRAFHLVARATSLLDLELPFATDEEADTIVSRGRRMLDEALALDPHCHDALRMRRTESCLTYDDLLAFMCETEREVGEHCRLAHDAAWQGLRQERAELGAQLAMRPHLRWLATIADKAAVCGHNRMALEYAGRLLEMDPDDKADVRLTAALVYAKLEDSRGLERLVSRTGKAGWRGGANPWLRIARMALAFKCRDLDAARAQLRRLVRDYPLGAMTLVRQLGLPDGVFARPQLMPQSDEELAVATSEGILLLQEGRDDLGVGALGSWVAHEAVGMADEAQLEELKAMADQGDIWGGLW